MSDFHWAASYGSSADESVNAEEVKYGDGYRSVVPIGLNTTNAKYSLKISNSPAVITQIREFLKARKGRPFTWTPPGETEIKVTCMSWKPGYESYGMWTLNFEFERFYG